MKNILVLLAIVLIAFGCTRKSDDSSSEQSTKPKAEKTAKKEAPKKSPQPKPEKVASKEAPKKQMPGITIKVDGMV